jgi:hypothetical protein
MHMASASHPPLLDAQAEISRIKLVPKTYRYFIEGRDNTVSTFLTFKASEDEHCEALTLYVLKTSFRDLTEEQCHPCP